MTFRGGLGFFKKILPLLALDERIWRVPHFQLLSRTRFELKKQTNNISSCMYFHFDIKNDDDEHGISLSCDMGYSWTTYPIGYRSHYSHSKTKLHSKSSILSCCSCDSACYNNWISSSKEVVSLHYSKSGTELN